MCLFSLWSVKTVGIRNIRTPKWEEKKRLSHSLCLLEVAKQQLKPWNLVISISYVEYRRRRWQPTPVLLPGKSHGRRGLVGCSPWRREESDTTERLRFIFSLPCIGDGMATHSSVLAWRTPGTGEPSGLPSMGSHRVGHDWSNLAAAAAACRVCK